MKKRILIAVLAACVLLSFSGCSAKQDTSAYDSLIDTWNDINEMLMDS